MLLSGYIQVNTVNNETIIEINNDENKIKENKFEGKTLINRQ